MKAEVVPASRREFLNHIFSATAFVVSAPIISSVAKGQQAATAGDATRWDPSVYLGIEVNGDGGQLFGMALLALVTASTVFLLQWFERKKQMARSR